MEAPALCLSRARAACGPEKTAVVRRLRQDMGLQDALLFADATGLRLFPPLRAAWARMGEQAVVPVTGRNDRRVLLGAINVRTGHLALRFSGRARQGRGG